MAHAGKGRQILQSRRIGSRSADDDRVLHRAIFFKRADHLGDAGLLLADSDVDADQIFALLVDDRVDGDGRLAGLAVTDDQLTLTTANRNQRIDGGDSGLNRRIHRLAHNHARRDAFQLRNLSVSIGPLPSMG